MIRPWYKSLVFWLGIPMLGFIVWLWAWSMFLQVRIENWANTAGVLNQWTKEFLVHGNSAVSYSWADFDEDPAQTVTRHFPWRRFHEKASGTDWFPALSLTAERKNAGQVRRVLTIPYWCIVLAYCGAWVIVYRLRTRWVRRRYAHFEREEWKAREHADAHAEPGGAAPADPRATRSRVFRKDD
jgi:hypothetical protein